MLKGVMGENNGKALHYVAIGGVVHMPQLEFNLFSISKIMEEGWKIGGKKTAIWLQNNDQTIKFDTKLKQTKEQCIVNISNVVWNWQQW